MKNSRAAAHTFLVGIIIPANPRRAARFSIRAASHTNMKASRLRKARGIYYAAHFIEVFNDDPLIVCLGVRDDLFADSVIGVRDETPLSTRDTLERLFGALAAVGLERSPCPFVAGFFVADILRRVEFIVRCHSHAVEAEIDAETALWLFNLRRRDRDRNVQVEVALAID